MFNTLKAGKQPLGFFKKVYLEDESMFKNKAFSMWNMLYQISLLFDIYMKFIVVQN